MLDSCRPLGDAIGCNQSLRALYQRTGRDGEWARLVGQARGKTYGAGRSRYNIARLLQPHHRPGDALHYARAALHNYERTGPDAGRDAVDARELITQLEQQSG